MKTTNFPRNHKAKLEGVLARLKANASAPTPPAQNNREPRELGAYRARVAQEILSVEAAISKVKA